MTETKWNSMTDKDRWQWVMQNQDKGFIVMLDNDDTFIQREDGEQVFTFTEYLGWSEGVVILLDVIGVRCECV